MAEPREGFCHLHNGSWEVPQRTWSAGTSAPGVDCPPRPTPGSSQSSTSSFIGSVHLRASWQPAAISLGQQAGLRQPSSVQPPPPLPLFPLHSMATGTAQVVPAAPNSCGCPTEGPKEGAGNSRWPPPAPNKRCHHQTCHALGMRLWNPGPSAEAGGTGTRRRARQPTCSPHCVGHTGRRPRHGGGAEWASCPGGGRRVSANPFLTPTGHCQAVSPRPELQQGQRPPVPSG